MTLCVYDESLGSYECAYDFAVQGKKDGRIDVVRSAVRIENRDCNTFLRRDEAPYSNLATNLLRGKSQFEEEVGTEHDLSDYCRFASVPKRFSKISLDFFRGSIARAKNYFELTQDRVRSGDGLAPHPSAGYYSFGVKEDSPREVRVELKDGWANPSQIFDGHGLVARGTVWSFVDAVRLIIVPPSAFETTLSSGFEVYIQDRTIFHSLQGKLGLLFTRLAGV